MFTEEHYSQYNGSAQTCPIYREISVECFVSEQRVYILIDKYETIVFLLYVSQEIFLESVQSLST